MAYFPASSGGDEWEDITSLITWNTNYVNTSYTNLKLYENSVGLAQATGKVRTSNAISTELSIGTISDTSIVQVLPSYKGSNVLDVVINAGNIYIAPHGNTIAANSDIFF